MNKTVRRHPRLALVTVSLASLLLSACGGGGSSNDGGSQTASNSITSENARATAASAFELLELMSGAGSMATDFPAMAKSSDLPRGSSLTARSAGTQSAAPQAFARFARDKMRVASSMTTISGQGSLRLKAAESFSNACNAGGSVKLTLIDADDSGSLSAPDSMLFEFNRCAQANSVINGRMRLSGLTSIESADGRSGNDAATVGFENLTVIADGATQTANGGFSLTFVWDDYAGRYDLTLSGQSFQITDASGASELANFSFREFAETSSYRFSVAGSAHEPTASFTLATPIDLRGRYGSYPASGSLVVTAPDNSRLTLTALSATTVQLDVDSNGDGQTDTSEQLRWDELEAAAAQNH